jgi:Flp pilus assembly protein TadB
MFVFLFPISLVSNFAFINIGDMMKKEKRKKEKGEREERKKKKERQRKENSEIKLKRRAKSTLLD